MPADPATLSLESGHLSRAADSTAAATVPWYVYSVLFASTSVILGVLWDISWHQTIGRDTFWTPAHLAIYVGGVVAGLTCGWLALQTTFAGSQADRDRAVRFWGFYAPFGAWVCIWGTFAMLTSAPFDDWWHNTYGLDVKILSPPHVILAAGIGAIQVGAMLMVVAWQNRTRWTFAAAAAPVPLQRRTHASQHRHALDRIHRALGHAPLALLSGVGLRVPIRAGWSRTRVEGALAGDVVALVYTAITMVMLWLLPLFHGRPLLGPIYVPLDRFLPPDPPLLLVVPAIAIDFLLQRFGRLSNLRLAALMAPAFVATFVAVQWPFADFLMTPWARLVLRHRSHGVYGSARGPGALVPARARGQPGGWTRDRDRPGLSLLLARAVVGRVDGQGAAMISRAAGTWRLLRMLVIGLALTSMAHVGSPDTFFTGNAGPYPVRVTVRLPGVVPGLAQVTVRVPKDARCHRPCHGAGDSVESRR